MGRRQHRVDGAPGELAVPDLAPPGRAHAAGLADRIGREVVVQEEGLLVGAFQAIDVLLVLAGAERRDGQRLRLAASEERRAVGARQDARLGDDRAHRLHVAPVNARAGVENVPAHDLRLRLLEGGLDLFGLELRLSFGRNQLGHDFRLDRVDRAVALLLDGLLVGVTQLCLADRENGLLHFRHVGWLVVARLLCGLFGEAHDRLDDRLEMLVAEHHGPEHHVFRQLLRLGLDHQHRVLRAGHDEVERGILHLGDWRVQLVPAVDVADASAADRAHEGDAGERQRGGGRHDRDDVGIVLEVVREHRHDDLGVVLVALDEQRPDRAIDEARGQRLLLGRAALALEVAAGDAAGRIGALLVVHGEREEVEAGLRLLVRDDGREHGGLAIGRDHGAVGLPGHLAGFEHELAPAPDQLFALDIEHLFMPSCGRADGPTPWARRREAPSPRKGEKLKSPWRSCHGHRVVRLVRRPDRSGRQGPSRAGPGAGNARQLSGGCRASRSACGSAARPSSSRSREASGAGRPSSRGHAGNGCPWCGS